MKLTGIVGGSPLWAEKDKDAILNYTFDLTSEISDGDRIVSAEFAIALAPAAGAAVPSTVPLVKAGQVVGDTWVTIALRGGDVGVWFVVTGEYTTQAGMVDDFTLRVFIKQDAELQSLVGSALFPNRFSAVQQLRRDRLGQATAGLLDPSTLSDDALWLKLTAAEAEVARKLGVFLTPTEVFPVDQPTDAQIAALNGRPWVVEAGYDLPPDFFQVGNFGALKLTHPLVSKVSSMTLVHPALSMPTFTIPPEWILIVGKYGFINVLPGGGNVQNLPLSLFTLQAMGAGYPIPQMIRIQFTSGLTPASEFYPEVVDAVLRVAAMSVLTDAFVPQSGSISADGLSQSTSQDLSKHQDAIDKKLEGLRERLVGPVWGVL